MVMTLFLKRKLHHLLCRVFSQLDAGFLLVASFICLPATLDFGYSGISIFRAGGQVRSFLPRYIGDSLFIPLNVISVPGFSLLFKAVYLCYVDVESTSKISLPLYNDLNE
jgi:hypothetical protein